MKKAPNNKLTLKIEGARVSADKFLKAVDGFLGLLRNVSDEVSGRKGAIMWVVDVEPGSVVLNASPYPVSREIKNIAPMMHTIRTGIRSLEKSDTRPKHFSDAALWHARELASVIADGDKLIDKIVIGGNGSTTKISQHTIANVDGILATARTENGSVEGKVSVLSDRRRFEVQIDDILTGQFRRSAFPAKRGTRHSPAN
ncbi:MAG: hypothetical protein NT028_08845 [candidate division Zixibacteria bacterium]|nr:hypothetical protein [candidate division Zixibacteria bacterium]